MPARGQLSNARISMEMPFIKGGIIGIRMSNFAAASERATFKRRDLVGDVVRVWWYHRLGVSKTTLCQ